MNEVQGIEYWKSRPRSDEQKDWTYGEEDWLDGYWKSREHPHRELILHAINNVMPIGSLLEVGCNVGPNLAEIHDIYPSIQLTGIDVNTEAIAEAQRLVPFAKTLVADLKQLPFENKSFDAVLSDAVLLYIEPKKIVPVLDELDRVTRKAMILVERYHRSKRGREVGHVWGRNYPSLLSEIGYSVSEIKLNSTYWPTSLNWQKYGKMYIAVKT